MCCARFCDGSGRTTKGTSDAKECRFRIYSFYPISDLVSFSIRNSLLGIANLKTSG